MNNYPILHTMKTPISDLNQILCAMEPVMNAGTYVFVSVQSPAILQSVKVVSSIQEAEGFSAVIAESDAIALGLPILFRAAWITLTVNSDLQAVGLTTAFSAALAKEGISCNVVAGAVHDHLFVPVECATDAMKVLTHLQKSASSK
jgi:hypothetical protein